MELRYRFEVRFETGQTAFGDEGDAGDRVLDHASSRRSGLQIGSSATKPLNLSAGT